MEKQTFLYEEFIRASYVPGAEAEHAGMKCDQISNTFTVVAICTFASDLWGTSDSKWNEVRHVGTSASSSQRNRKRTHFVMKWHESESPKQGASSGPEVKFYWITLDQLLKKA